MNPEEEYQKVYKFKKNLIVDKLKEMYEIRITKPLLQFYIENKNIKVKLADWITGVFK